MNTSLAAATAPGTTKFGGAFWERLWRLSGVNFVIVAVVAYFLCGPLPPLGASPDELAAFYGADRTRILIAVAISGMALLNLLWFVAALRSNLASAERDGWGSAATAASAIIGAFFLLALTVIAVLAFTGTGIDTLTSRLNDVVWVSLVSSSFPRAMLIMAGSFGLWRAGTISSATFAVFVAAVVLVLLGGTTWMSDGFWSPDGAYSRFVSPMIGVLWLLAVSRILLARPATRGGW